MTFVSNHLVDGALGMSQSEFPMWVPHGGLSLVWGE